jgi:hypothetical protein
MFVLFDSTNQIFDQLMKAKDQQKSGDGAKHVGYFKRFKHMSSQALNSLLKKSKKSELVESDTFIYVRGDESSHYHGERGSKLYRTRDYPAYGMDIPGACTSKKKTLLLSINYLFQVCQVVLVIYFLVNFHRVIPMVNMQVNVFI